MVKADQLKKITQEAIMKRRMSRNDELRLQARGAVELIAEQFNQKATTIAAEGRDYVEVYIAPSLNEIYKKSVNFNHESRLSKATAFKKYLERLEVNDRHDDYHINQLQQTMMCIELMNEFDSHGYVTEFIHIEEEAKEYISVRASWSEKYS